MAKNKQVNGVTNVLTPQQEQMRAEVVDLELKARYWKAQFEIRHYTLENERVQGEYNAFLEAEAAKRKELLEEMMKQQVDQAKDETTEPETAGRNDEVLEGTIVE